MSRNPPLSGLVNALRVRQAEGKVLQQGSVQSARQSSPRGVFSAKFQSQQRSFVAEAGPTGQQQTHPNTGKDEWGRGVENARGLRTAAPSSADRGLAEAGAPIFLPGVPAAPRLGHPMVSSAALPDTPMSQAPHVATPPYPGHPTSRRPTSRTPKSGHPGSPAEAGSSPAGTGGGRAEGHLPIRARWRTGSTRAPAGPASKLPAGAAASASARLERGRRCKGAGAAASPSSAVSILSGGRR